MWHHHVLHVVAKLVIPLILLFALYVQFHGDFGPGGGFQAGVIFAAGLILYGLVFGVDRLRRAVPPGVVEALAAAGVLLYAGVGVAGMALGGSFLGLRSAPRRSDGRAAPRDPGDRVRRRSDGGRGHDEPLLLFRGLNAGTGETAGGGAKRKHGAGQDDRAVNTFLGHYNYWVVIALMMIASTRPSRAAIS